MSTTPTTPNQPTTCTPPTSNNVIDLRHAKSLVNNTTAGPVIPTTPSSSGLTSLAQRIVAATLKGKERMV